MAQNKVESHFQVEYSVQFTAYIDTLPERIEAALEIVGGMVESNAKNICPVDTGRLRDSMTHFLSQSEENTEIIGTSVKYAPWVELGHAQQPGRFVPKIGKRLVASHVEGKPFLRPALENHVEEYREVIARVLDINNPIPQTEQDAQPTGDTGPDGNNQEPPEPDEEGPWIVID